MTSKQYEKELSACSTLSAEELKELFENYKNGSKNAYNKLIESNLKLVIHLAKGYFTEHTQDLIQEGNIGLMIAIQKFNPNINIMFSTYAAYWIRKGFNDFIISDNTIKMPQNIYYEMKKNDEMLKKLLGDFEHIFAEIEDENNEEEIQNEKVQIEMILAASKHLMDNEFLVLSRFFGIGCEKQTLVEISKGLNISRQRTHQIKEKALEKIRKFLKLK